MAEYDSAIPPGGQGKVTASIDSTRFKNKTSKSVTLTSNDPDNPRVTLRLSAEILVPLDVRPNDRIFVRGKAGSLDTKEFQLVSNTGQVFDIKEAQKRSEYISLKFEPAPELAVPAASGAAAKTRKLNDSAVASGHSAYKMTVSFAKDTPPGRISDRIRLITTHEEMTNVDITVSGQVQGNVTVAPERLFFFSNRNGTTDTVKEVRLAKRPEGGFEIKKVTSTDATFQAQVKVVERGLEYAVEVTRLPEAVGTQASARLVIETNDPLQPKIEVPVTAR